MMMMKKMKKMKKMKLLKWAALMCLAWLSLHMSLRKFS